MTLPCLESIRIGENFLEHTDVQSKPSRCYMQGNWPAMKCEGVLEASHLSCVLCLVPLWHSLEHPVWAGNTQAPCFALVSPKIGMPLSFPRRMCVIWNIQNWRRKTLGSRKEKLHTHANVKPMLYLTMVHIVSGYNDVRALLWNSSKSWVKQRQHAWKGCICD